MRILLYRYGSICEPDIIDSLRYLKIEVTEYSKEITDKKASKSIIVNELSSILTEGNYDAVMSFNFYPHLSALCEILHIKYISWTVDSPVPELYSKELANSCNRTFIFDRADYEQFKNINPDRIFHKPLGVNIRRLDKFFDGEANQYKKLAQKVSDGDVSFVASLYTEKDHIKWLNIHDEKLRGYIEGISVAQSKINGAFILSDMLDEKMALGIIKAAGEKCKFPDSYSVDNIMLASQYILGIHSTALERERTAKILSKNYKFDLFTASETKHIPGIRAHATITSAKEVPIVSRYSKINLNLSSKPIRTAAPWRIFDVLGAGGFLISNYQSEIEEIGLGNLVPMFTDDKGMLETINYYLANEAERKDISSIACDEIRCKHSLDMRLLEVLEQSFSV